LLTTGTGFNFEKNPNDFVSSTGIYSARVAEVRELHEQHGLETLVLAGCEGILGGRRSEVAALTPELREAWIQLMLQLCEDESILGSAERLLYVGKAI
jgi:hypothetical protein